MLRQKGEGEGRTAYPQAKRTGERTSRLFFYFGGIYPLGKGEQIFREEKGEKAGRNPSLPSKSRRLIQVEEGRKGKEGTFFTRNRID